MPGLGCHTGYGLVEVKPYVYGSPWTGTKIYLSFFYSYEKSELLYSDQLGNREAEQWPESAQSGTGSREPQARVQ